MGDGPQKTSYDLGTIFGWRQKIFESDLPSTTRHVLITLSCRMNKDGSDCYPSTKTISEITGLTERTVCTHLERAEKDGWILRETKKNGKGWKRHHYTPTYPTESLSVPIPEGTELNSAPVMSGTESLSVLALKQVQSTSSSSTTRTTRKKTRKKSRTELNSAPKEQSNGHDDSLTNDEIMTIITNSEYVPDRINNIARERGLIE